MITQTLEKEERMGLGGLELYRKFADKVKDHRQHLLDLLARLEA